MNGINLSARTISFAVVVQMLAFLAATGAREGLAQNASTNSSPTTAEVERLIQQLGASQFEDRERAERELESLGSIVYESLLQRRRDADIEIRLRASQLVSKLRNQFLIEDVDPALKQYLDTYASNDLEIREAKIAVLARLLPQQSIRELARIARFEDNQRLSKTAALEIISRAIPQQGLTATEVAGQIRDGVGISETTAARWLRLYADVLEGKSKEAGELWQRWQEEEEKNVERDAGEHTSRKLVAVMRRLAGDFYQLEGRPDQARKARRDVSASLTGSEDQINEWVDWLLQRSAWEAILDLMECQPQLVENNAKLLYALAEANLRLEHDPNRVEELVQKALDAVPSTDDRHHYQLATYLEDERGRFEWAEREYRLLIDDALATSIFRANAFLRLASMYDSEQQPEKGAKVLQDLLAEVEKSDDTREVLTESLGTSTAQVEALVHFYLARVAASNGNQDRQREELERAAEADPGEADVLIAMYRMETSDKEWIQQVRKRIRDSSEKLQREISQLRRQEEVSEIDNVISARRALSGLLNHYAWLISNTEGDFEEALRLSQQSLAISPGDAGLLDTLARCYYALGEFEQAIKYQKWAVQRSPHEGQIRRQLELFQSAKNDN